MEGSQTDSDPSRTKKRSASPAETADANKKKKKKKKKSSKRSGQSCNNNDMALSTNERNLEPSPTSEQNLVPCQTPGPVTFEVLPEGALDQLFEGGGMVESAKLPPDISKSLADYCKYLERFETFAKAQAGQIEEG